MEVRSKRILLGIVSFLVIMLSFSVYTQLYINEEYASTTAFTQACSGLHYPEQQLQTEAWVPVDESKTAYVFSAYHDAMQNTIQFIGIRIGVGTTPRGSFFCQLWYEGSDGIETDAVAQNFHYNDEYSYTSCKFTCDLPKDSRIADTVSLVKSKCASPLNLLRVKNIKRKPYTRKFTVCLSPLNQHYNGAYQLRQWIELNKILGADAFVVYNYSSGVNVSHVLDAYSKRGLIEIVQWKLPHNNATQPLSLHYYGQTSALNECLLRSKETSEFVVNLDLDEFIIPHANNVYSWEDMLKILPRRGAYVFRHAFFRPLDNYSNYDYPRKYLAEEYHLTVLLNTQRDSVHKKARTKYITRSNAANFLTVHDIGDSMAPGQKVCYVSPKHAFLYHYRDDIVWDKDTELEQHEWRNDMTMVEKYKDVLIDSVANVSYSLY